MAYGACKLPAQNLPVNVSNCRGQKICVSLGFVFFVVEYLMRNVLSNNIYHNNTNVLAFQKNKDERTFFVGNSSVLDIISRLLNVKLSGPYDDIWFNS